MNIGEIQQKLNTDLTELCQETERLKGLKIKWGTISDDIAAVEDNLKTVRERVSDLQGELIEAMQDA